MAKWRVYSKRADFEEIGERYAIDKVVARIIRNRDIEGMEAVNRYINGDLDTMYDSLLMKDMKQAVDIIGNAIDSRQKIRIIGDYDIDGICSIYILFKGLLSLGADVDYEVPDRIADGYGINQKLIEEAHNVGRDVILTCDNGIAAVSQIEYAKSLGMTVVVTDHHDVRYEDTDEGRKYIIPQADAVVDPKRPDCEYPFKSLCGAGIALKFIGCLYETRGIKGLLPDDYYEMAAVATIGDVVDLQEENRIIVKEGLKRLRKTNNPGLNALITLTGINKEDISAYHIGFVIGPCLNASGRLDTAKRAIQMLLATDIGEAERYAGDLKSLNDERKELTVNAVDNAIDEIESTSLKEDRVLVVFLPDCHESIAGIVAGKIKERYYRPTIVLTRAEEGVKGSARSIESYNIFEKLLECDELLTKFGGHPMAAGLSLPEENIESLRRRLNENCNLTEDDLTEVVWIDVPMPIDYISEKVISDIKKLEPFGKGNEKPVFADKNLIITGYSPIGRDGMYTKLTLENERGYRIEAMAFFKSEELKRAFEKKTPIGCTYYPEINEFRGNKKLQIVLTGCRME